MKKCTSCQNVVNDNARFCSKCGGTDFAPFVETTEGPTVSANGFAPQDVPTQTVNGYAAPQASAFPSNGYAPADSQTIPLNVAAPQEPERISVPQTAVPPVQEAQPGPAGKKGGNKTLFIILGAIAAVLVIGLIIFFVFSAKKDHRPESGKKEGGETASVEQTAAEGLGSSPIVFKQIGQVDDPSFSSWSNVIYKNDNEEYVICDPFGNDNLKKTFVKYQTIQKAKGLFVVTTSDPAPNNVGLVNSFGKVYIPYDAASIRQLTERFFKVCYTTNKTTDKSKAMFTYYDDYLHTYVDETKPMYEGYEKVFDLVTGDFVPGIENDQYFDSIYSMGDYIRVYDSEKKTETIYNTSLEVVKGFPDGYGYYNSGYYVFSVDDKRAVYDKDANYLFSTNDKNISKVFEGEYYSSYDSDKKEYTLYRKDGTKLFDEVSRFDFVMIGSAFKISKESGEDTVYGLIDLEGNEILPPKATYIEENRPATGFTWAKYGDKKYSLLFPDGYVLNLDDYYSDGCIVDKVTDDEYSVFIFADEEYKTLNYSSVSSLTKFLVSVRDETGKYGVMDTFSGEMLLPIEYTRVNYCYDNDCIYALNEDDQWEIYATHENDYAAAEKVKRTVLTALDAAFKKEGISATVDLQTGEVALDNTVLFELDKADLSAEGKTFLQKFMRAYTSVVFDEKYEGYIDSILIEGHTDTDGTRAHNLELSQNRADNVMAYCLSDECGDSTDIADMFSAVGIADDRPVMKDDGTVNMEASRRVTFMLRIMTQEIEEES